MFVATADRLRQLTESRAPKKIKKGKAQNHHDSTVTQVLELRAVKRRPKTLWQRQMQVLANRYFRVFQCRKMPENQTASKLFFSLSL